MRHSVKTSPPRSARWLLSLLVARRDRADLLADLEEEHAERASSGGAVAARRWYWSQALRSLLPSLRRRLELAGVWPRSVSWRSGMEDRSGDRRRARRRIVIDLLNHDLASAVRQLARSRWVSVAAALCVALGVGVTTTILSVGNSLLLRPPPGVPSDPRLVEVGRVQGSAQLDTFSLPTWGDLRAGNDVLEHLAAWAFQPLAIGGEEAPEVVLGLAVSSDYFRALSMEPAVGHFFGEGEAGVPGAPPLVVLSEALYVRRFASDPRVIGSTVRINSRPATVIGVAPHRFRGHHAGIMIDAWVPLGMSAPGFESQESLQSYNSQFLVALGRLRDGVTLEQARSGLETTYAAIVAEHPELREQSAGLRRLRPVPSQLRLGVSAVVGVLLAVSVLVLWIACVNTATLILVRSLRRRRELAVRQVLGAGRRRLLRQLLIETVVLFLLGGGAGVLLALGLARLLSAIELPLPPPFNLDLEFVVDTRVLVVALLLSAGTGLVFGLAPALRAARLDLASALRPAADGTAGAIRLRRLLVAGQVALTTLLLLGAGLLVRALGTAQGIDPGFDPRGVHAASLDLDLHGYDEEGGRALYRRLVDEVGALPGVESVALARQLPLGLPSRTSWGGVRVPGHQPPPGHRTFDADLDIVSDEYFRTLRIPRLGGREFAPFDATAVESGAEGRGDMVAIVNQAMAERFWPQGAIGQAFGMGRSDSGLDFEVVGVVADSKHTSLREEGTFFVYLPLSQQYRAQMNLLVRARGGGELDLGPLRQVVQGIDPDLPLDDVVALEDYVALTFFPQRVMATVAGALGGLGLLLAMIGIYGVAAHQAQCRRYDIGVRLALGAGRGQILRSVVAEGVRPPLLGLLVGTLLAVLLTRFLESLLFGIHALDAATFLGVGVALAAVAFAASLIPAGRAARLDPSFTLHSE